MTLDDALAELRGPLLTDDADLASGPDDRLWSDETLIRYINAGQREWARRTLAIRDDLTPAVTQVQLETGIARYELHPAVRSVISARYDTDPRDLGRFGHRLLGAERGECEEFDINAWANQTGAPRAFSTDESFDLPHNHAIVLTLVPTPTAAENGKLLYLRTTRMPLCTFHADKRSARFEVPDEDVLDVLEYAAWRALRTSDIDGHAESATEHKTQFDNAVARALKAVRDKMYVPIRFATGSNGWAWGR